MKRNAFLTIVLLGLTALIIINSDSAKSGASAGWGLCENIIIPSLLPILIITNIIILSDCSRVVGRFTDFIFTRPLRVNSACGVAILLGLIAGYPAGAVLTSSLYSRGLIDGRTARRVMRYNFSGGIAFTIMVVGRACYGSVKIGILLYISNVISSLIIGLVSGIGADYDKSRVDSAGGMSISDALSNAVDASVKSILSMCAYIILFSAVNSIFTLPDFVKPFLEITNGVCAVSKRMSTEYCGFFLAFGGLCVHMQVMGLASRFSMKYGDFFKCRVIGGTISFFILRLFRLVFPQYAGVFSASAEPVAIHFAQVNTGLSIMMIMGCAILIFDIEERKLKC